MKTVFVRKAIFAHDLEGRLVQIIDGHRAINPLQYSMIRVEIYFDKDLVVKVELLDRENVMDTKVHFFKKLEAYVLMNLFMNAPWYSWNQLSYRDINLDSIWKEAGIDQWNSLILCKSVTEISSCDNNNIKVYEI